MPQRPTFDATVFVGRVVTFDPQPYGAREVRITKIQPNPALGDEEPTYYVEGVVVRGRSLPAPGSQTRSRDLRGELAVMYAATRAELQSGRLTSTAG